MSADKIAALVLGCLCVGVLLGVWIAGASERLDRMIRDDLADTDRRIADRRTADRRAAYLAHRNTGLRVPPAVAEYDALRGQS
jgi:hypothetical protein